MKTDFAWLARPGLAGGIDKTGERAGELLGLGFGSIEFGSVLADDLPALLGRLAGQRPVASTTAIGIGLGLPPELPPAELGREWRRGLACLAEFAGVAEYFSLNLSAAANRRFLTPPLRGALDEALAELAACRPALPIPLAVKLPAVDAVRLGPALAAAGVDQLTVVLPDGGDLAALSTLRAAAPRWRIVAVGGIVGAADVLAARAAGADGIQVHRLFLSHGPATPALLAA
jgi:dihydroorotate dehydrogenase